MTDESLIELSAAQAAKAIKQRKLTCRRLVEACLARIEARDEVGAWEFLDKDLALAQADRCDTSASTGPLHGVPVGIKDIIQTADMPTGYGSPIYPNNRTGIDAECVKRLRAAGAVILGKTVTTEFAVFAPGKTTNPHHRLHTPGGSSSGSAAAVADRQVPFALGTQTAGSVIRPASFCGIVGYKPSYARFSFDGVMLSSMTLDTLGTFTRTVEDAVLVGSVLSGLLLREPRSVAITHPRIGLFRTPWWNEADAETRSAIETTAEALAKAGAAVSEVTIPGYGELRDAHTSIMYRELAISRQYEYQHHRDKISTRLQGILETGRAVSVSEVQDAVGLARRGRQQMVEVFAAHDVLLTPSTLGAAPRGLGNTGDPIFNRVWTLLGVPCLTHPVGVSSNGLPLGVQIVGPVDSDERLFATTLWMLENSVPTIGLKLNPSSVSG
jgi:Asp-tRNA(Asn)/Glu-tRNA(Gln) amidotransferase A subunit family amidase